MAELLVDVSVREFKRYAVSCGHVICTCDIIPKKYGTAIPLSVRLYVRPSGTRMGFIKTAEHIIEILSDRPLIL